MEYLIYWQTPKRGKHREAFPYFMTLTEEERGEFYQTLHAAKVRLEENGIAVNPRFGTVHDNFWQRSDVFGKKKRKSNVFVSPEIEIGEFGANIAEDFKSCASISEANPDYSNPPSDNHGITENPIKHSSEAALDLNNLIMNCEEKMHEKNLKNNNSVKNSKENLFASLSYEVLNEYNDKIPLFEKKENLLRIKGTNLKVQVTLTSADNRRLKQTLFTTERANDDGKNFEKSKGKKLKLIESEEKNKTEFESVENGEIKPIETKIDDPEVKDLLNVGSESDELRELHEEDVLPKKEKKSKKKARSKSPPKTKEKKLESNNKQKILKTVTSAFDNIEGQETHFEESIPHDPLLTDKKRDEETPVLGTSQETYKELEKDSREISEKKKVEESVEKRKSKGSCKPAEKKKQQKLLVVKTSSEKNGSNISLQKQKPKLKDKKRGMMKPLKQLKLRKSGKNLKEKESLLYKKNELIMQNELNERVLRKEILNDEAPTEKQPSIIKKDTEVASTQTDTPEEPRKVEESLQTENISDSYPAQTPEPDASEISPDEEKEAVESKLEEETSCVAPFMSGKVVFVDDNVIEKIRNVILDLEKKAKNDECDTENEYLILLVEHVEYLSSVMENLFESQVLNPTIVNRVKFDEENLSEIQNYLQVSTTTTDNDLESDNELEIRKKLKRKKSCNSSISKLLTKLLLCKKSKAPKKSRKRTNLTM